MLVYRMKSVQVERLCSKFYSSPESLPSKVAPLATVLVLASGTILQYTIILKEFVCEVFICCWTGKPTN